MGLNEKDKQELEYEEISNNARLKLARIFRNAVKSDDPNTRVMLLNRMINIALKVLGKSPYEMTYDDYGESLAPQYGVYYSELEYIFCKTPTVPLVEIIADLIQDELLPETEINKVFSELSIPVNFEVSWGELEVKVFSITDIEEPLGHQEHSNIRLLVERMELCVRSGDSTGVLAASSNIFETLGKENVKNKSLENKTFSKVFNEYKQTSKLPEALLDYMQEIYIKRGKEPTAGHGGLTESNFTMDEAIVLSELTKACIRIERKLALI